MITPQLAAHPYWEYAGMIVSLLYKVTRTLLSAAPMLLRGEAGKDAELLVLRQENTVLRQSMTDRSPVERHERSPDMTLKTTR